MRQIHWTYIWLMVKKYVLNKYVVTLIVFGLIFLFVGEQSFIKDLKRGHQIRQTEQEIEEAEQAIESAQRQIQSLQQPDSLEKFAREHYLMHKDNEEIFLLEEE